MNRNRKREFFLILGCIFIIGASLRLYTIQSQLLLDDEWHSVNHTIGKGFLEVLTNYDTTFNTAPPFNLYSLLLLKSVGLSELGLRLPSILAGLLILIALPLLVKQIFGPRVALIFASFLAIAPFLVFYSRYARPYGCVALLCFGALLVSYLWVTTGKPRYAVAFVAIGALAVYSHLWAIVAIVAPLATGFFYKIFGSRSNWVRAQGPSVVSLRQIVSIASALFAILLVLLWPAILHTGDLPWAKGHFALDGLLTVTTLVSGTASLPLNILFFSLCAAGGILAFKKQPQIAWMFLLTLSGYIILLFASRPVGVHRGAVVLRYMIVTVPIALLLVSLALDSLFTRAERLGRARLWMGVAATAVFLICLFAAGPLPALYSQPNNFTNHSAFQASYANQNWEVSRANAVYPDFSVGRDQVPSFYEQLNANQEVEAIVEYPFDICDYNNLLYYYQHFHRKRVIAGYSQVWQLFGYDTGTGDRFGIGALNADQILTDTSDPPKLRFRNMVNIEDVTALSRCGASVIVLHKYIVALKIAPIGTGTIAVHWRPVHHFRARFAKLLGPPVYEDEQLVCFQIRQAKD